MIEISIHYPTCRQVNELDSDKVRIEFVFPKKPFLFWATVREAEEIPYPKGYGVAYYDLLRRRMLLAPMPSNIIIGWLIKIWYWFRVAFASSNYMRSLEHKISRQVQDKLEEGMKYRLKEARREGEQTGINKSMDWWDYVLSNRTVSDEVALAKRKEILGY